MVQENGLDIVQKAYWCYNTRQASYVLTYHLSRIVTIITLFVSSLELFGNISPCQFKIQWQEEKLKLLNIKVVVSNMVEMAILTRIMVASCHGIHSVWANFWVFSSRFWDPKYAHVQIVPHSWFFGDTTKRLGVRLGWQHEYLDSWFH